MGTRIWALITFLVIAMASGYHEDPQPLIGVELDPNKIIGSWDIQNFTRSDSVRTELFKNVVLEFDPSRQLFIARGSKTFEAIWSLRAQDLLLSMDVADTILRELSGVYVSQEEQDSLQLNLSNKNPRTPGVLQLTRH